MSEAGAFKAASSACGSRRRTVYVGLLLFENSFPRNRGRLPYVGAARNADEGQEVIFRSSARLTSSRYVSELRYFNSVQQTDRRVFSSSARHCSLRQNNSRSRLRGMEQKPPSPLVCSQEERDPSGKLAFSYVK